jgi:hypothetical protein
VTSLRSLFCQAVYLLGSDGAAAAAIKGKIKTITREVHREFFIATHAPYNNYLKL